MPFDLDAIVAEAEGEPFEFTFGGETYTMPYGVDFKAVAALQEGDLEAALRIMLGEEQWTRILASDAVMDQVRFSALMRAYMQHTGLDMGEAQASTDS